MKTRNNETPSQRPAYVLAHVCTPTLKDGMLLIPLVPFGDVHMNATICVALLNHGYTWREVKAFRRSCVHPTWTAKGVRAYVAQHGPARFDKEDPTP